MKARRIVESVVALLFVLGFATGGCGKVGVETVGECVPVVECDPNAPLSDKATCDDGVLGTADRCVPTPDGGAVCAHVYVECDGFDSQEVQAQACDDGDPCTVDGCLSSACVNVKGAPGCTGGGGSCPEGACAAAGYDCGLVYADCNGDGAEEAVSCGLCGAGDACMGSGTVGQCGHACATTPELQAACAAAGQGSHWAFPAGCPLTFLFGQNGEVIESCAGCGPATGCSTITVEGAEIACCSQ